MPAASSEAPEVAVSTGAYRTYAPERRRWGCCVCGSKLGFHNVYPTCGFCYKAAKTAWDLKAVTVPQVAAEVANVPQVAPEAAGPEPENDEAAGGHKAAAAAGPERFLGPVNDGAAGPEDGAAGPEDGAAGPEDGVAGPKPDLWA